MRRIAGTFTVTSPSTLAFISTVVSICGRSCQLHKLVVPATFNLYAVGQIINGDTVTMLASGRLLDNNDLDEFPPVILKENQLSKLTDNLPKSFQRSNSTGCSLKFSRM